MLKIIDIQDEFVYAVTAAEISFCLHCSLDVNKDKMIHSAAVTA